MTEDAYYREEQMIETNYIQFKNMIENVYIRQKEMIETNASMIKNYATMLENKEVANNIEKVKSQSLKLNEESKKIMLNQLELIKHQFLSNAIKLKEEYNNMINNGNFTPNFDG